MLNRSKTWAVALLVATFIAGTLVGAGARVVWVGRAAAAAAAAGPTRGPDRLLASLTTELHLTPLQHDTIGAIIYRHWVRANGVWNAVQPRFDTIRVDMDSEVVRHLSPDQVIKYRDHVTRYRHQQVQEHSDTGKRR